MLTKRKRPGGRGKYYWYLTPPDDLIEAGVARTESFYDGRTARAAQRALKKKIEAFRAGELAGETLPVNPTMAQLVAHYLDSSKFKSLSSRSKEIYRLGFQDILETPYGKKPLSHTRLDDLTSIGCAEVYDDWVDNNSVSWANEKKRIFGVLMSHALSLDLTERNPMASVKAIKHEPEVSLWTREQVEQFLDIAFSDFKYRPVGLLVLLCYEFGQRPIDIALLKWDNVDLPNKTISLTQNKRGAKVYLPLSDELAAMLSQQKEDFDFQPYVLPYLRGGDSAWRPMNSSVWTRLSKEVKEKAGLPDHLKIRGLRTTAITEMVSGGADALQIKQVSGHKNVSSLNPYVKNTRKGAVTALGFRNKDENLY